MPPGTLLLTGTGLVPDDEFTLLPGQWVEIHVPEIGTLANPVAHASRARVGSPGMSRFGGGRAGGHAVPVVGALRCAA